MLLHSPLHTPVCPEGIVDTLLQISFINLLSGKRHLAGCVRTAEMCQCGCGGHDTIHGFMLVASMIAQSLVDGIAPPLRHDGEDHVHYNDEFMTISPGSPLGFKGAFCYLLGDWGEYQKSLGLGSWAKTYNPCPICTVGKDAMLSDWSGLGFGGMPAADRVREDYLSACSECEIEVNLASEADLRELIANLAYTLGGHSAKGRAVIRAIPRFGLARGDRLEPSKTLVNPNLLEKAEVPLVVYFWRNRRDRSRRVMNWLSHRCPLFGPHTEIWPATTLTIDSLHCVYLGCMARWTSATLHRILQANPWANSSGFILQSMVAEFRAWQIEEGIPASRRIANITPAMLGDTADDPHPGGTLKLKAAEVRVAMSFAINLLGKHEETVSLGKPLLQAGLAMAGWLITSDTAQTRLTHSEYQAMVDNSVRHRYFSEQALVGMLPKHHAFGHLSVRTGQHLTDQLLTPVGMRDPYLSLSLSLSLSIALSLSISLSLYLSRSLDLSIYKYMCICLRLRLLRTRSLSLSLSLSLSTGRWNALSLALQQSINSMAYCTDRPHPEAFGIRSNALARSTS
jgi:hypothetical protein